MKKLQNAFLYVCFALMMFSACTVAPSSLSQNLSPSPTIANDLEQKETATEPTRTPAFESTLIPSVNSSSGNELSNKNLSYEWESITNGNLVRSLIVSTEGDIWTVGSGGVVRWDPNTSHYTKYTSDTGLASNRVMAVTQTQDGILWFGTDGGGLSRFDGKAWKTYTANDGLKDNRIFSLAASPTGIWIGTAKGLVFFDGNSWTSYNSETFEERIDAIGVSTDGTVWIGGKDLGLFSFDGKQWSNHNQELQLGRSSDDNFFTTLSIAPDGSIWVGSLESVHHFNGKQWTKYQPWESTGDQGVSSIAVDREGHIWVGFSLFGAIDPYRESLPDPDPSRFSGVYYYDGQIWKTYSEKDGLISNEIRDIEISEDQTVWFGSYDKGISRFDGQEWKTYQTEDGLASNNIYTLVISNRGELWAGSPVGTSYFDGNTWKSFRPTSELFTGVFSLTMIDDGSLIANGNQGIAWYKAQQWSMYSKKAYSWINNTFIVEPLQNGVLAIGSHQGAFLVDSSNWNNYQQIIDQPVHSIIEDQNDNLWLGTEKGLYIYDQVRANLAPGSPQQYFWASATSQTGELWFGTNEGILCFDGKNWKSFYFRAGDLPAKNINGIVVDSANRVWATSSNGLLFFDGGEWKLITSMDGLADNYATDIEIGPDGSIWIATFGGISHLKISN